MHKACEAEQDMACNAYCAGDTHVDLAYCSRWVPLTPETALASLQRCADWRAQNGAGYALTILDLTPVAEAPTLTQRYPTALPMGAEDTIVTYRVRYRVGPKEETTP